MGSKTHILVVPFPVQGHISPVLQFSKRLASKGLLVTFLTTITDPIQSQTQFTSLKIEHISDGYEEGEKPDNMESFCERIRMVFSQNISKIIEKQNSLGYPIKVVIYDSVMPWLLDIAHQAGVLGATFFTQSCAVSAVYYHTHQGRLKVPFEGSTVSIPGLPPLKKNDLPSFISDMDSYPFLLKMVINKFVNLQKADWMFFNTFDKLEDEVVKWMASLWPIKTIGPTIPSIYLDKRLKEDREYGLSLFKSNAETSMKWLDTKKTGSVVYVSFGSLANLEKDQMEEIAWGLVNSNCYFLWVVRDSEENKLPSNFMYEKGLVVNWCSQLEVLDHRAVGCFLTHCGWNSILEALSLGVPIVAMPQWTDQTTNAKFVADVWRVGVRVEVNEKGIIRREEVEKCITEVMEGDKNEEFKKNANGWKGLAKEAVDEGGSSDNNIDEFISKLEW